MDQFRRSLTTWPGRALPAVLYAVCVFVASVANPPGNGVTPLGPLGLVGLDKWLHLTGYAVFAVLVAHGLWRRTTRPTAIAAGVVVAVGYGVGMEVVQSTLPLRSFDRFDMLANTVGAVVAGCLLWVRSRIGG